MPDLDIVVAGKGHGGGVELFGGGGAGVVCVFKGTLTPRSLASLQHKDMCMHPTMACPGGRGVRSTNASPPNVIE